MSGVAISAAASAKIEKMIAFVVKIDEEVSRIAAAEPLNNAPLATACANLSQHMTMKADTMRRTFDRYKLKLVAAGRLPAINNNKCRFSKEVEALLTVTCAYLASQSMSSKTAFVVDFIMMKIPEVRAQADVAKDKTTFRSTLMKWFKEFLKRPDIEAILAPRKPKAVQKSRAGSAAGAEMMANVEAFVDSYSWYCEKMGEPSSTEVMNFDESRLTYGKDGSLRITSATAERSNIQDIRHASAGSLVTIVSADGSRLIDTICIAAPPADGVPDAVCIDKIALPLRTAREARDSVKLMYVFSKSGFFDTDHIKAILKEAADAWCIRHGAVGGGNPIDGVAIKRLHLFCDNLAAHRNEDLVLSMLARNVFLWYLPANTSHFTQPLDAAPFAAFNGLFSTTVGEFNYDAILCNSSVQSAVLLAAHQCLGALSSAAIKRGFASTHLAPFCREDFLNTARQHLGAHLVIKTSNCQSGSSAIAVGSLELMFGDNGVIAGAECRTQERNASLTQLGGIVHTKTAYNGPDLLRIKLNNEAFTSFSQADKVHKNAVKAAQTKHSKELQQARKVCRVAECGRSHTVKSKNWFVSQCGDFMLCNEHAPDFGPLALVNALEAHKPKCASMQQNPLYQAETAARAAALECQKIGGAHCAKCARVCDGTTDEVSCSVCSLWVHADCINVSAAEAGVDGVKYYCSSTCALTDGAAVPPRLPRTGAAVTTPPVPPPPPPPKPVAMTAVFVRNAPKAAEKALKAMRGLKLPPNAAKLVGDREWAKRLLPPQVGAGPANAADNAVGVQAGAAVAPLSAEAQAAAAAEAVAAARALVPAAPPLAVARRAVPVAKRHRFALDSDDAEDEATVDAASYDDDTSESSNAAAELQRVYDESSDADGADEERAVVVLAAVRADAMAEAQVAVRAHSSVRAAANVRADASVEVRARAQVRAGRPAQAAPVVRKRAAPAGSPAPLPAAKRAAPASAPPNERVRPTRNRMAINVSVNVSLSRMFRNLTETAKGNAM
jgi:hypothetical protein